MGVFTVLRKEAATRRHCRGQSQMVIPQDNHLPYAVFCFCKLPYAVFCFRKLHYIVGRYDLVSRLAHIGGNLVQCLCQIGKDIVNMLNPH